MGRDAGSTWQRIRPWASVEAVGRWRHRYRRIAAEFASSSVLIRRSPAAAAAPAARTRGSIVVG